MGNDDYSSTNKMTGGSLPAQAWHAMMAPAHQSVELKPIPGLDPAAPSPAVAAAKPMVAATTATASKGFEILGAPQRPAVLNKRSLEALDTIESSFKTLVPKAGAAIYERPDPATTASFAQNTTGVRAVGGRIVVP